MYGVDLMVIESFEADFKNYGSKLKPNYVTHVRFKAYLNYEPDAIHTLCVSEELISHKSVPISTVVNFRGSEDGSRPYYRAWLLTNSQTLIEYIVEAKYRGGTSTIIYEPLVKPSTMSRIRPFHFKSLGYRVLDCELNNYRFTVGLKRYEVFTLEVHRGLEAKSSMMVKIKEAGSKFLKVPCPSLLETIDRILRKLGETELKPKVYEKLKIIF